MTQIANLRGAGEDLLPEELALEVKGADGEATLENGATTIVEMVAGHPKDCTRGIEGARTSTSSSPCRSIRALPHVVAPYIESLAWDDEALAVAKGPPIDSLGQGHFLTAYF